MKRIKANYGGELRAQGRVLTRIKAMFAACIAKEQLYGSGFLLSVIPGLMGAVSYFRFPVEPDFFIVSLVVLNIAAWAFIFRHLTLVRWLGLGGLCFILGFSAAKFETLRVQHKLLGESLLREVRGEVASLELQQSDMGKQQARVQLRTLPKQYGAAIDYSSYPAGIIINLTRVPVLDGLSIGDKLEGRIQMRPNGGAAWPYGYDFGFYNYFKGISALGYYSGVPTIAPAFAARRDSMPGLWQGLNDFINKLRLSLSQYITKQLPDERGAVLVALITGQRASIAATTNNALRKAGLAHILAISGLHMGLVSGLFLILFRLLLCCCRFVTVRYSARKVAALLALFGTGFYLLLSGMSVAAVRSFIMVSIMLLAMICDRPAISLRNLVVACWVCILVQPHEIMGPSFQMSFAATGGLIAGFNAWLNYRGRVGGPTSKNATKSFGWRLLTGIVSIIATSVIAGAATTIFSAYYFNNTAPLAVFSNLGALPLLSFIVMPLALLGCCLAPFGLGQTLFYLAGVALGWIIAIGKLVAAYTPDVHLSVISPAAVGLFALGLVILICLRSWLCLFGLGFMGLSFLIYLWHPKPVLIVSDNGRLVGLIDGKGLYVNQVRASGFTTQNWQQAFDLDRVHMPVSLVAKLTRAAKAKSVNQVRLLAESLDGRGFYCGRKFCWARSSYGGDANYVITAKLSNEPLALCLLSDFSRLESAIQHNWSMVDLCADRPLLQITQQEIARRGSAVIWSDKTVRFTYAEQLRPWNYYRR